MDKIYDCKQISNRYGVKIITVYDWIKKGKLSAIKIGKAYRIQESAIIAFENERRTT